jgi:AAA+ superfamily predicted ATPase
MRSDGRDHVTEDARAAIDGLRHAVDASPGDVTLRRILADRLARAGELEAATEQFRAAIALEPGDFELHLGLADAYLRLDRAGAACVVLDQAIGSASGAARSIRARLHVLHARALLADGNAVAAAEAYRVGYLIDPSAADPDLANAIGLRGLGQTHDGPPAEPAEPAEPAPSAAPRPSRAPSPEREPTEPAPATTDVDGVTLERPRITFADVGGLDDLKEQINLRIVHPFTHPDLYRAYGQRGGGGLLLYGPPGCGKTYLARATAGELGAAFISIGIADVLEMWIGQSERNLHRIFEIARAHRPTVLFFDEADALAADRASFHAGAGRTVINQFLAELDGVDAQNDDVLVIGATNAPWHLDAAFRRPGRFDQVIFVPPPDAPARVRILETLLRDKPTNGLDLPRVAKATDGFSGADLKGLVDRAVQRKLVDAIRDGVPHPIETSDLLDARRGITPTTTEWFATVRNYVLYSNESGLYDPVRPYLPKR